MVVLALGGNLPGPFGNCITTLQKAVSALPEFGVEIDQVSSLYQTSPVPPTGQPDFLNLALLGRTAKSPQSLMAALHALEERLGREREERWSARTLDIDIIFYGDAILPDDTAWKAAAEHTDPSYAPPEVTVPHPRMHKRAFVLVPLTDIAPAYIHPVLGQSVSALLDSLLETGNDETLQKLCDPQDFLEK
ncbi:2-amino-4-hydroxy-6-hydroxymethyldihydropteridine diphosphokinase [Kordiimonas sediminis]|uniref:2-amino-4-hydroxy-6-hydroxymethyldihydropteridine pyrophosphokinase n=2 Tax=Kordiimonas sediminis TaxID=1735581 RepID=A0A919EAA4_9PROT|nr:2-amino-4-hydroxy-6-hydroxymethyldihydropteridine diphosphokinase [Kordiimonas sediminis]